MADTAHRRGLKFRRRDDYAVELFRTILDRLDDRGGVNRALLELGRFYNPLVNGPIVDLATRRRILDLLESGRAEDARRIVDERLSLYTRADAGSAEGADPGGPAEGGARP